MGNASMKTRRSLQKISEDDAVTTAYAELKQDVEKVLKQNSALSVEIAELKHMLAALVPPPAAAKVSAAAPAPSAPAPSATASASAPVPAASAAPPSTRAVASSEPAQVMISLNVASMYGTAIRFKEFLEQNGVKVWVCTQMEAGIEFRDEIVDAVDGCTVFLPLINTAWAESAECEAEFNYAFRKNLKSPDQPRKPVIIPICFPDLDWNKHKHVRLLLASTNALVWSNITKEPELLASLALSMKRCGVKFSEGSVDEWDNDKVCQWLQSLLLRPVKERNIKGHDLMQMSGQDFLETLGFSKYHVDTVMRELPVRNTATSTSTDGADSEPVAAIIKDPFSGLYKVLARTINDHDGNVTTSNEFLVKLDNYGIASSGCIWNAGTLHDNYDGVTCVWQGKYRPDGSFSFTAEYSNNTREEYAGVLSTEYIINAKYCWWGYNKQSYGCLDAILLKLSANEEARALSEISGMIESGSDHLHNLSSIGRPLSWDGFEEVKTSSVKSSEWEEGEEGWVKTPCKPLPLSTPFVLRFRRPEDARVTGESDWISLCPKGSNTPWHPDAYFGAWNLRTVHGIIFYSELVPSLPGPYELVYFAQDGTPVARHPVMFAASL